MDPKQFEALLGTLHESLAQKLLDAINDPEGCAPSTLNVARQFLKDHGIDSVPQDDDKINQLAEKLPTLKFEQAEDAPISRSEATG